MLRDAILWKLRAVTPGLFKKRCRACIKGVEVCDDARDFGEFEARIVEGYDIRGVEGYKL
jgi:hypothetical protein